MRNLRIISGIVLWLTVIAGAWWVTEQQLSGAGRLNSRIVPELWQFAVGNNRTVPITMDDPIAVAVGDPIFRTDESQQLIRIGEIAAVVSERPQRVGRAVVTRQATALFYPDERIDTDSMTLTAHSTPDSMDWVVRTMLPPERQQQIMDEIQTAFAMHREELVDQLRPVVQRTLQDALTAVEQDLGESLARHQSDFEQLGQRYDTEILQETMLPLVKAELWPIVQEHAEPLANEIGLALWKRVSLWRFTWRYLYDVSPLPERKRFDQEWQRFVREEALPELNGHTDQIVEVARAIITDASRNQAVRQTVRDSLARISHDPETHELVWQVFRESVIDNPHVHQAIEDNWMRAETQQAVALASERMEPTVQRIGAILFGTRNGGITPEFASVLRNRILEKDRRWFIATADAVRPPADRDIHGAIPARRPRQVGAGSSIAVGVPSGVAHDGRR